MALLLAPLLATCLGVAAAELSTPAARRITVDAQSELDRSSAGLRRALTHYFATTLNANADQDAARDEVLNELAELNLLLRAIARSPGLRCRPAVNEVLLTTVRQATTLIGPLTSEQPHRVVEVVRDLAARVNTKEYVEQQLTRLNAAREPEDRKLRRAMIATGSVFVCVTYATAEMMNHAVVPTALTLAMMVGVLEPLYRRWRSLRLDQRTFPNLMGGGLTDCARALEQDPAPLASDVDGAGRD